MLLGEVVDELLNQNGLADTGTAEQARLAATDVGLEQVDSLDAGLEDLGLGGELVETGRCMVDGVELLHLGHGLAVDRLAQHVPDAAEGLRTYGHLHRCTSVLYGQTAYQAVGRRHGYGANQVTREVHLNLENDIDVAHGGSSFHGQSVVDRRHMIRSELNVDNRANDTDNVSDGTLRGRRSSIGFFSHLCTKGSAPTTNSLNNVLKTP